MKNKEVFEKLVEVLNEIKSSTGIKVKYTTDFSEKNGEHYLILNMEFEKLDNSKEGVSDLVVCETCSKDNLEEIEQYKSSLYSTALESLVNITYRQFNVDKYLKQ